MSTVFPSSEEPDLRVTDRDKAVTQAYYENRSGDYDGVAGRGPLRYLRQRERNAILRLAGLENGNGRSLVDVGTGGGFYALRAKDAGFRVCALDVVPAMVERLRDRVDEIGVADVESLERADRFDVVICSGVLEFVRHPEKAFRNLSRLVAPGGRLVVMVPCKSLWAWLYRFEKKLSGINVNLYSPGWFARLAYEEGLELQQKVHPLPSNLAALFVRPLSDADGIAPSPIRTVSSTALPLTVNKVSSE